MMCRCTSSAASRSMVPEGCVNSIDGFNSYSFPSRVAARGYVLSYRISNSVIIRIEFFSDIPTQCDIAV